MVAVLFNAGLQVPVIPFNEVVGNAVNIAPLQIEPTGLNEGVIGGSIVTEAVAITPAQPPLAATV